MSSTNTNLRALIIGIDGGTWTILRPAIERGYMPFLKSLVDSGASGIVNSTIPAMTPPAWAAFQTGMNPGKTGVFSFTQVDRASRRLSFVSSVLLRQTLWDVAGNAGRKVVVLNVPMTYPPHPVNGCMVTGLMTPSTRSEFTYPPELKGELLKAVPGYHIFNLDNVRDAPPPSDIPLFLGRMQDVLDKRTQAAEYLMSAHRPDLCMVHFQTPDLVQHALWSHLDPMSPLYDPEKHSYILEHFYRRLDGAVGRLHAQFAAVGGDFMTAIVSDHGFESHTRRFNIALWLQSQGILRPDPKSVKPPLIKRITRTLRVGKFLSLFVSKKSLANLEKSLSISPDVVDWRNSRAFVTSYSGEAGIYFLDEDPSTRAELAGRTADALAKLIDPKTGEPFLRVCTRDSLYHGPMLETMPDLIVIPSDTCACNSFAPAGSPIFEDIDQATEYVLGKHHPEGIVVSAGPGIAGRCDLKADIVDVAPTVLYAMGVPIPSDMDGKVITSVFTEEFLAARGAPQMAAASGSQQAPAPAVAYSPEDEKEIQKKLRELGYM